MFLTTISIQVILLAFQPVSRLFRRHSYSFPTCTDVGRNCFIPLTCIGNCAGNQPHCCRSNEWCHGQSMSRFSGS
ncbi:hypothetical protein C8R43DRAFT_1033877 [Mycena crocata]|nr:hypothetical protein C8R43DRAFT_1033877 [Mycena crocata]